MAALKASDPPKCAPDSLKSRASTTKTVKKRSEISEITGMRLPAAIVSEKLFMIPEPSTKLAGYSLSPRPVPRDAINSTDDSQPKGPGRTSRDVAGERRTVGEEYEETEKQKIARIMKQLSLGPVGSGAQEQGFLVSHMHWMAAGHTQRWPFRSRLQCRLVSGDYRKDIPSRLRNASCCARNEKAPVGLIINSVPYKPPAKFA